MHLRLDSPLAFALTLGLAIALATIVDRFLSTALSSLVWAVVMLLFGAVPRELFGSDAEDSAELVLARYYA